MITAGLVLQMCVVAMLVSPVTNSQEEKSSKDTMETSKTDCLGQSRMIWGNKYFLLLGINTMFLEVTASIAYTHIAAYGQDEGLSEDMSNLLITVLGICTIGK